MSPLQGLMAIGGIIVALFGGLLWLGNLEPKRGHASEEDGAGSESISDGNSDGDDGGDGGGDSGGDGGSQIGPA